MSTKTDIETQQSEPIGEFPYFRKVLVNDKVLLEELTRQFPVYSDFNFVSLFSWNIHDKLQVSLLNANLVLLFTDYESGEEFLTFIGNKDVDETAMSLLAFAASHNLGEKLLLLPETVIENLKKPELFEITEDRDNHDYILSVEELVQFRTNTFRGKKNLHNRFQRHHGERVNYSLLDVQDPTVRTDMEVLALKWQESRQKSLQEVENELRAIRRCLDHADSLNVKVFGIYVGAELVAYTVYELVAGEMAIIHFDKANVDFIGVFEHLKHSFAKHLSEFSISSINYEQDLGHEGLRRSKTSYHPVNFHRKFTLKLKPLA